MVHYGLECLPSLTKLFFRRFVFTFAIGAGPVPGLLLPEIFPSRIRAKAMAVCMSVHWVIFFGFCSLQLFEVKMRRGTWRVLLSFCCSFWIIGFLIGVLQVINFFVGLLFLRLLEQLGAQLLYSVFGSFCVMAVVFVKRNVMETKGKTLQEIEIALLPQE